MRHLSSPMLRPWIGLAGILILFSCFQDFSRVFWTSAHLSTVLQQASTNIILATGMTLVIVSGGIDLSVGSVMALSGITLGMGVKQGLPWYVAVLMSLPVGVGITLAAARKLRSTSTITLLGLIVCSVVTAMFFQAFAGGLRLEWALTAGLLCGAGCGLLNGLASTLGRVPPFIATLGMLTAARSLTVYATQGNSISGLPERLRPLGVGLPLIATALIVALAGSILLTKIRAGRYLLAIGGNETASRLSGLPVDSMKCMAYAFSGLCAALAAITVTAKFGTADTNAGVGAELHAIAASVIGGASLSGGRGSMAGTLAGALTIAVLSTGLVLIGVADTLQGIVIGSVIVVTVMVDQLSNRHSSR